MPKPAMNNPVLENEIKSASVIMLKRMGWPGTPLKAVITEDAWTIYRNDLTGNITHRAINAAVSVKLPDGNCKFYNATFEQQYAGGKYGKTEPGSTDNGTDIDCGNAQK